MESIALARQFITGHFVSRGMVVDFAVHEPEREEGSISNPHFRFLCLIRPIEQNGKWGLKQKREYVLDENGNRISDGNGDYAFNAVYVHTADKSSGHRVQDVTISYNYIGILSANLLYDAMNGKAA